MHQSQPCPAGPAGLLVYPWGGEGVGGQEAGPAASAQMVPRVGEAAWAVQGADPLAPAQTEHPALLLLRAAAALAALAAWADRPADQGPSVWAVHLVL